MSKLNRNLDFPTSLSENKIEKSLQVKDFFKQNIIKEKFKEIFGNRSSVFVTSLMQIINSSELLQKADPISIFNAATVAATLDLPLNNSLGFAYIIPYNQRQKDGSYKIVAQFQIGYKGIIQLAQRSKKFKTISATPIYEEQIIEANPLTGYKFDFSKKIAENSKIAGYAAFFELLNGFQKILYMSIKELNLHGKKYSQTFKKDSGLWKDNFDSMAIKTVLKLLLSKYAPLSVDEMTAIIADQSVINNPETLDLTYVDNEEIIVNKEEERFSLLIENAKTIKELENLISPIVENLTDEQMQKANAKREALRNGSK